MSGSNNDGGGSWGSRFLKVAGAAAATAAVAGGLYALLSSSAASELEVPFGTQREGKERDEAPLTLHVHKGDPLRWKEPEIGWVKLNVDGSRDHHRILSAGCGGVLRDRSAEWLHGFAQKLNPNFEAHQTELQAILKGLEVAWKVKVEKKIIIEKLVVESDCDSALIMVKNGVKKNHEDYDVVERIRKFCFDPKWEVKLVSIAKEPHHDKSKANGVADRLANNARELSCDYLCQYHAPPPNCMELLKKDKLVLTIF